MKLKRRLFRMSYPAVALWVWQHRGTAMRMIDALRRAPARIREQRPRDLATELQLVARLDRNRELARETDLRIGTVGEGSVTLAAPSDLPTLADARLAAASTPGVIDVRVVDREPVPVLVGGHAESYTSDTNQEATR